MSEQFEQKLQLLSNKLNVMHKPDSLAQLQVGSRDQFIQIRRRVNDKLEAIQKSTKLIEERVQKYQSKINYTKKNIHQFSTQRHQQLLEIVQQQIQRFDQNLNKAKFNLKNYQTAAQVSSSQIQKNREVLIKRLQQKIQKNIKKIQNQIEKTSQKCSQERELIKRQFLFRKGNVQQLVLDRNMVKMQTQKLIDGRVKQLNVKASRKMEIIIQKWLKKDEKTNKIIEMLILQDTYS